MDVRKINLYDIDEQMREILDGAYIDVETGEFVGDIDKLTELEMLEDKKIESLALYIRELQATAAGIKPEADRLYAAAKKYERFAEGYTRFLGGYLGKYCARRGVKKYQGNIVSVGYHHSKATLIFDEEKAFAAASPLNLVTVETKYNFDKKGLRKFILKNPDKPIDGVAVVDNETVQIM